MQELSREEIEYILSVAKSFQEISLRPIKKVPVLRGKTVVNLFFEPSTRTRTSFELAAKRLSADLINFSVPTSSLVKGETVIDTAQNIEAMKVDCFIIRHSVSGVPALIARNVKSAVINAGDGSHEHPTQALLDLFTIKERKKRIKNLRVAIIGDIRHSRVARSEVWGLTKLGAKVILCGPSTLIPEDVEKMDVEVTYNKEEAIKGVDVIYLLRLQQERQRENFLPSLREYIELYQLRKEDLELAKDDFLLMHPGPMNRGVELSSEVAESRSSLVLRQVTNGIAVRMAVLYILVGEKKGKR